MAFLDQIIRQNSLFKNDCHERPNNARRFSRNCHPKIVPQTSSKLAHGIVAEFADERSVFGYWDWQGYRQ